MKHKQEQKRVKTTAEVLCYKPGKASRSTVSSYYKKWRISQGIPYRCDLEDCQFYNNETRWKDTPLLMILDHVNGNPFDNNPGNLRYVCPNCDSQLPTRGAKNKGRVSNLEEKRYFLQPRYEGETGAGWNLFTQPGSFGWSGPKSEINSSERNDTEANMPQIDKASAFLKLR